MTRRYLFALVTIVFGAASLPARSPVDPVNRTWQGLALKGYDAVAYHAAGKPVKGSAEHTHDWKGATWRFASRESLERFRNDPEKYAPQYGGYCAWAVSNNYTADADPEAWKIVNGKLYLNYDRSVQQMWERERDKRIAAADRNWPELHK